MGIADGCDCELYTAYSISTGEAVTEVRISRKKREQWLIIH
jgi:hypothetical protein